MIALFFSTKYWPDSREIEQAVASVEKALSQKVVTVVDGDLSVLPSPGEFLVVVPCSGSVQPDILTACHGFSRVALFASYVEGNFDLSLTDRFLSRNAGPTLMDVYAVLKRTRAVRLLKTTGALQTYLQAEDAASRIRNARIALVEKPEPWVISVPRDFSLYQKRLGVDILSIPHDELLGRYRGVTHRDAQKIYAYFKEGATEICEPTDPDIQNASRMAVAMLQLLADYHCDGMAVACFDLIKRAGINPCLGVSYINGETPYFAACEGDVDSAVTMLFLRALSCPAPWMANPSLQPDDSVNFAHCTAPICGNPFRLRNHHETGIGASPQVEYSVGLPLTLCRYGGQEHALTLQRGRSIPGRYEPNCRTQLRVQLENPTHYLNTVLGCHQVLTFDDNLPLITELASILGIPVI